MENELNKSEEMLPAFKTMPKCEVCQDKLAISFSYFQETNEWKFCCMCTAHTETYYIEFDRFFKTPRATVDWLAHMSEKRWMNWSDFMAMMRRFRADTDSYWET